MKKISLMEIKHALMDSRFRDKLPEELEEEISQFLKNPSCACNHPLYRKILKLAPRQLSEYYPGKEPPNPEEEIKQLAKNDWTVISCHINELQNKLRELPPGRKQLDLARWQDQVTIVVNNLDVIF